MSDRPEFSHKVKLDGLPDGELAITADESARKALAERFALPAIHSLKARLTFEREGAEVIAHGTLSASFEQDCAVAGEPFENTLDEPLALRFVPETDFREFDAEDEVELAEEEFDEIAYSGQFIDVGEAIAQSFGLALDPYAEGPQAGAIRAETGIESDETKAPSGPLQDALKALKKN